TSVTRLEQQGKVVRLWARTYRMPATALVAFVCCLLMGACTSVSGGGGGGSGLESLLARSQSGNSSRNSAPRSTASGAQRSTAGNTQATPVSLATLTSVYDLILQHYVDPVDPSVLIQGAISGMEASAASEGLLPMDADVMLLHPTSQSKDETAAWQPFSEAYSTFTRKFSRYHAIGVVTQAALRGMLDALNDPHTSFIDSKTAQQLQSPNFSGVGVVLWSQSSHGPPIVREVLPNSPAA